MTGRAAIILMLLTALLAGGGIYYSQVYAYYTELDPSEVTVELTSLSTGQPEAIIAENIRAIDANSSPIRYRACFETTMSEAMLSETYVAFDKPVPNVAPGWFSCFDANAIGEALEEGQGLAFLGERNIQYGVDRVVAIMPDGRGYAWQQLNSCGEKLYDGSPADPSCPDPANFAKPVSAGSN